PPPPSPLLPSPTLFRSLPSPATPYRLRRDAPAEFQEILLSAETADAAHLYWFEDGTLIASGDASRRMFLRPTRGVHHVVVVDDSDRKSTRLNSSHQISS